MKPIRKGSLAGCLVCMDDGSTDRLAQKNLQIPEHAYNRTLPSRLIDAPLSVRDRLTLSHPDATLVTPIPIKSKPPSTPHLQQVQHARSQEGLRRAHNLKANERDVHLIEVKYCEDARPGHQLKASSKQHETQCRGFKAKKVTNASHHPS